MIHSGTAWDNMKQNLDFLKLCFLENFLENTMLLKLPTRKTKR